MGYCSDVRILIEEKNFNKLCEKSKKEFPKWSFMDKLDIKHKCIGKDDKGNEILYIYFGWNCVKFYYDEAELVENFVKGLDEFHYVRIGENWDDIDEYYNLNKTDVDCISVSRGFYDPIQIKTEGEDI
jgi:hypothetical protein